MGWRACGWKKLRVWGWERYGGGDALAISRAGARLRLRIIKQVISATVHFLLFSDDCYEVFSSSNSSEVVSFSFTFFHLPVEVGLAVIFLLGPSWITIPFDLRITFSPIQAWIRSSAATSYQFRGLRCRDSREHAMFSGLPLGWKKPTFIAWFDFPFLNTFWSASRLEINACCQLISTLDISEKEKVRHSFSLWLHLRPV